MTADHRLKLFMRHYSRRTRPRGVINEKRIPKSTLSPYEVRKFMNVGVVLYTKHFTKEFNL